MDRILNAVAASLTGAQRQIYELSTRQGLRGQALATALQVTEKKANDDTYENIKLLEEGFGAYILARDGRPFCPVLVGILDAFTWDEQVFPAVRQRILRHLDTCKTCGNCATCRDAKKRLIVPYAPALLPILCFSWLHERVMEIIRMRPAAESSPLPPAPPSWPGEPPQARRTAPLPARQAAPPPDGRPAPSLPPRGRGMRRLRLPAAFGAAIVVPFVLALLITRMAVAGSSPPASGAAAMPAIAYATDTALVVRQGTAPPRALATPPVGSVISQLFWSADGRWLGWFSGPANGPVSQVHITDVTTGATDGWPCGSCVAAAFQGSRLLAGPWGQPTVTAFPVGGGNPKPVSVLPAGASASPILLGTVPRTGTVLSVGVSTQTSRSALYELTPAGQASLLSQLPHDAMPGGNRDPGGPGLIGPSPGREPPRLRRERLPRRPRAALGQRHDREPGHAHSCHRRPARRCEPPAEDLRGMDRQLGTRSTLRPGISPPSAPGSGDTETPQVYRLQGTHWIGTGVAWAKGGGGRDGWMALLASGAAPAFGNINWTWTGDLVASAAGPASA